MHARTHAHARARAHTHEHTDGYSSVCCFVKFLVRVQSATSEKGFLFMCTHIHTGEGGGQTLKYKNVIVIKLPPAKDTTEFVK